MRTAQQILRDEGYAAVTVRRIAKEAGVSSTLLHYYYPRLDDLIIAIYRYISGRDLEMLTAALGSKDPVRDLWAYQTDSSRTALGAELLAWANHRPALRAEITRFVNETRAMQAALLRPLLVRSGFDPELCSPECLAMLLTSVSRNLVIEAAVGISEGHAQAREFVDQALTKLINVSRAIADGALNDQS